MNNSDNRYQNLLLAHGSLVTAVGLIAGLFLVFSMLGGFVLWPVMNVPYELPGSVRGWKAAHVGGITNGLLLFGVAFAMTKLALSEKSSKFVFWSILLTGWGNTLFYWAGNLSPNRGLSMNANVYGETNLAGYMAFLGAGSVMLFTIAAMFVLAHAAFKQKNN